LRKPLYRSGHQLFAGLKGVGSIHFAFHEQTLG
jgi:hypothetical protein